MCGFLQWRTPVGLAYGNEDQCGEVVYMYMSGFVCIWDSKPDVRAKRQLALAESVDEDALIGINFLK